MDPKKKYSRRLYKIYLEKHYDFYPLPNVMNVVSSRGMRWAGSGRNEIVYEIILGTQQGRNHFGK
jgi:hypothetical protein